MREFFMPNENILSGDSPRITVGIGSFPYLGDHALQDMVVLPGAFYIETALCLHVESLNAPLGSIRRVEYRNPVILSERDTTIAIGIKWLTDQTVQYTFHEVNGRGPVTSPILPCATLAIDSVGSNQASFSGAKFDIEAFQKRANYFGDQAKFYGQLRQNGNQYGTQFQGLRQLWRADREALGRVSMPRRSACSRDNARLVMLDCVMQLLSIFFVDQGRTFVLQGIDEGSIGQTCFPEEVWVHARLKPDEDAKVAGMIGDLDVFDDSGTCCLKLRGVRFNYLDGSELTGNVGAAKTSVVIASTFTAEPIEDSLKFWADYFGFPVRVCFAPYSQVFQELLSSSSQLRRNIDGVNVVLLNLEDWTTDGRSPVLSLDKEKAESCFENLDRCLLPNGLDVAHLNRYETDYLYQEIFEDQCYMRHGIRLPDDATVIDVGANIGLFSLFVRSRCPQATVFSFEPSPVAFRVLNANCEAYGPRLHPFNVGVSDQRGTARLNSYKKSSVFSSFHSNAEEDRQAIEAVVANMVRSELGATAESVDEYVKDLMTDRLEFQTFECRLMSVSDIIRENDLKRVDLLKVDAEKCELEILRGIENAHWPLIDQIVIEVHDQNRDTVEAVQDILVKRGFRCAVEQEALLSGSGLFNVYATRQERVVLGEATGELTEKLRADLQGKVDGFVLALDSFTQAVNSPTVLCLCPPVRTRSDDAAYRRTLAAIECNLLQRVCGFPNLHAFGSETILARYPTAEFRDVHTQDLGHIPYTAEGFAAIGSSLFRTIIGQQFQPYKVIVLDCDNTLWQGACGEEGPLGIVVTPVHRMLQEFMIRQMDAGMLLCLCSKNSEADVWSVFEQNANMVLKRGHFVACRVNWEPKSKNLRLLAEELNLGLESVIFVDDNPVECAEIRANCPEVVVLQLPQCSDSLPQFLEHAWAFDHLHVTDEDRRRTQMVQENVQRETYREQIPSLKEFIDGLQLEVAIAEPTPDQFVRLSQLTIRTNQFNFTTSRKSEKEIIRYLAKDRGRGLVVQVSDRFGDYGIVGLVLYDIEGDGCVVDTFLLSCRVLGRGIEHRILAELGRRALDAGKQWVEVLFRRTDKNQPAWDFIYSIGVESMRQTDIAAAFRFPAGQLVKLRYEPQALGAGEEKTQKNNPAKSGPMRRAGKAARVGGFSEKFQRIADNLNRVRQICSAIEAHRMRACGFDEATSGEDLPATLEGRVLRIWRKAIGNAQISINDRFFDVGGTSLKAVQIVAAVRRDLNLHLSVVNLLEYPTVRLLCQMLDEEESPSGNTSEAMARGARRKQRTKRRG
jgi:FkbH-like protein/FkbM family methyltransferase